jgi:hypothetical protein
MTGPLLRLCNEEDVFDGMKVFFCLAFMTLVDFVYTACKAFLCIIWRDKIEVPISVRVPLSRGDLAVWIEMCIYVKMPECQKRLTSLSPAPALCKSAVQSPAGGVLS